MFIGLSDRLMSLGIMDAIIMAVMNLLCVLDTFELVIAILFNLCIFSRSSHLDKDSSLALKEVIEEGI